jgi:hypothetical protein
LKESSGSRLGGSLEGIDTPTLLGIWETAPYLHDGSAPTLRDVLTTENPSDAHAAVSTLASEELDELIAYLEQIDGDPRCARCRSKIPALRARAEQVVRATRATRRAARRMPALRP